MATVEISSLPEGSIGCMDKLPSVMALARLETIERRVTTFLLKTKAIEIATFL